MRWRGPQICETSKHPYFPYSHLREGGKIVSRVGRVPFNHRSMVDTGIVCLSRRPEFQFWSEVSMLNNIWQILIIEVNTYLYFLNFRH
jgi:hypothetical protein